VASFELAILFCETPACRLDRMVALRDQAMTVVRPSHFATQKLRGGHFKWASALGNRAGCVGSSSFVDVCFDFPECFVRPAINQRIRANSPYSNQHVRPNSV
jgi:hypothetical protein